MKIHIDNVHINVPRETKPALHDIPVNTVTRKYHVELIHGLNSKYLDVCSKYTDLKVEHKEWGDKNDRLEARRKELQTANTELGAKLIEDAKAYDMLKEDFANKQLACEKLQGKLIASGEVVRRIRKDRDELLEAATKPSTKAEKALPQAERAEHLTYRGLPRKNRRTLTDEEVWQIRRFVKAGRKNIWIARQTGLPEGLVGKIKRGETYTNVAAEPKGAPICLHVGWGVTKQTKKDKAND